MLRFIPRLSEKRSGPCQGEALSSPYKIDMSQISLPYSVLGYEKAMPVH